MPLYNSSSNISKPHTKPKVLHKTQGETSERGRRKDKTQMQQGGFMLFL